MRGAWGVAFAETVALLVAERHHHGAGLAVVDAAVVTALFVAMLFQLELPRSDRSRVSGLGWLVASSAFTVSMGGTLVFGGERMFHGVSVAGLTLLGVTAMWTLLAAAPSLAGRRHAELTDLLAGFGLATAATATGLLAGGAGLVCAWAAEAAVLVAVAERVAGRDPRRRGRIVAAAGVYYGLALV